MILNSDKQSLKNQNLMISSLDKIAQLAEQNKEVLQSIDLNINQNIINGNIYRELQKHTQLLESIVHKLGGSKQKVKSSENTVLSDLANSDKGSDSIVKLGKMMALIGIGFYTLGQGLLQLKGITPKEAVSISLVVLTLFGSLALISTTTSNIKISDVLTISILMVTFAMTIQDVSRIFSNTEIVPTSNLVSIVASTIIIASVSALLMQGVVNMFKDPGAAGIAKGIVTAGIGAITSFGMLVILPVIALVMVSVAQIFRMAPDKLNIAKLGNLAFAALSLLPIVFVFGKIFTILRGNVVSAITKGVTNIVNTKLGIDSVKGTSMFQLIGSTLAIIPMLALTLVGIAWLFKIAPKQYIAPPMKWSIAIGVALILFSLAFVKVYSSLKILGKGKSLISTLGKTALVMSMLGGVLVGLAWTTQLFPSKFKTPPIGWIIGVGLALIIFAKGMVSLIRALTGQDSAILKGGTGGVVGGKTSMKDLSKAALAQVLIGGSIVSIAFLMLGLPAAEMLKSPPFHWTLSVGIAMLIFSKGMTGILRIFKVGRITWKDIVYSGLTLVAIGAAMVALSFVMMALPKDSKFKSPPFEWSLKVGFSIWIFSKGMANVIRSIAGRKRVKIKDVLIAGVAMSIIGASMVTLAFITMALPNNKSAYKAPPFLWSLQVGFSILAFAFSFKIIASKLGRINIKTAAIASMTLSFVGLAIVSIAWAFSLLPEKESFKSPPLTWIIRTGIAMVLFSFAFKLLSTIKLNTKSIIKTTAVLTLISGAVVGLAWTFSALPDDFKTPPIDWIIRTTMSLLAFGVIFWLIGKLGKKPVIEGSAAMLMASLSLVTIAFGIKTFLDATKDVKNSWESLAQIGVVIVGLGLAMAIAGAGPIPGFIALGSGAMIIAGAALITISEGIKIFMDGIKGISNPWESIAQIGVVIVGLGLAMAGLSLAAPFIIIGSAAMLIAASSLIGISDGIIPLLKLNNKFPKSFKPDKDNKTPIYYIINSIGEAFSSLSGRQILKIYGTAPAMIFAGHALTEVSEGLASFSKLIKQKINITQLSNDIVDIISVLSSAFAEVSDKYPVSFLDGLFGNDPVSKGIRMAYGMGDVLTDIASGVQSFANLRFKNSNGKMVNLKPKDMLRVQTNIEMIVKSLSKTFGELGKNPDAKSKWGWFGSSNIEKGVDSIRGMGDNLSSIATTVRDFANLTYTDSKTGKKFNIDEKMMEKVGLTIKSIVKSLSSTLGEIGKDPTAHKGWWAGSSAIDKGKNAIDGVGKNLLSIVDTVKNVLDLSKNLPKDFTWGKYDNKGNLITKGTIETLLTSMILSITAPLAIIGEDNEKSKGSWGFFKNGSIENGAKLLSKINDSLSPLLDSVKLISETYSNDTDIEKNAYAVLLAMPRAITRVGLYLELNKKGYDAGLKYFENKQGSILNVIKEISTYVDPMKSIANSFEKISKEMGNFKGEINDIDALKLDKLTATFNSLSDIYKFQVKTSDTSISDRISEGLKQGFDKVVKFTKSSKMDDFKVDDYTTNKSTKDLTEKGKDVIKKVINKKESPQLLNIDYKQLANEIALALESTILNVRNSEINGVQ